MQTSIQMDSPPTCLSAYLILCELGHGSFGVVYKVQCKSTGFLYVLKRINSISPTQPDSEIQVLSMLNHPHIIRFYTSFVEDGSTCIILEYAEGGDLHQLLNLHKQQNQPFAEPQIWRFAWEISLAIDHLHRHHIIHRDVKCQNILLTKDLHVKLGDLGTSKITSQSELQLTRVGTPLYLSPEQVRQHPYDNKVDIWALGCVLYLLTTFEAPFRGENLISLGTAIVNKRPKPIPTIYSQKLGEFIAKLLEKHADDRPAITDILNFMQKNEKNSGNFGTENGNLDRNSEKTDENRKIRGKIVKSRSSQALKKVKIPEYLKDLIQKLENPSVKSSQPVTKPEIPEKDAQKLVLIKEKPANTPQIPSILSSVPIKSPQNKFTFPGKPLISMLKKPYFPSDRPAKALPSTGVIDFKPALYHIGREKVSISEEEKDALRRIFASARPKTAGCRVRIQVDEPCSPSLPLPPLPLSAVPFLPSVQPSAPY